MNPVVWTTVDVLGTVVPVACLVLGLAVLRPLLRGGRVRDAARAAAADVCVSRVVHAPLGRTEQGVVPDGVRTSDPRTSAPRDVDAVVCGTCSAPVDPARRAAAEAPQARVLLAARSHEVRTPLHQVLGLTRLLLDSEVDDRQRRWLEAVHRSALDLLSVVDDVLGPSQVEGGRAEPERDVVDLPLPRTGGVPSVPAPRHAPPPHVRGRVLVADDSAVNLLVARAELESRGLEVDTARDGRQAVDAARSGRYDLVLMDCQMPVLDGLAATRLLRADPRTQGLPVVAVTASALAADRLACQEAGMDGFLAKPWRPDALDAVLRTWLQQDRPQAVHG